MPDVQIEDLTELASGNLATGDLLPITDVSDTSDDSGGTTKKTLLSTLASWLASLTQTLTNKTITYADNTLTGVASSGANTNITSLGGLTTPLTVAQGGTGAATHTSGNVLLGAGTSAFTSQATTGTGNFVRATSPTIATPQISGDQDLDDATGNVTVAGADPWRTVTLTPGFLKPATTSGCASSTTIEAGTNDIDYDVLDFDASSDEVAFANFQMPDSWDGGVIQFRYLWTNASGLSTETLQFELSGRSFANDDEIDQAVGTPVAVDDTWIAQGDVHISAWSGDVTLAGGPAAGEWVHLELMRDVSDDTLTGDARLISLQIRYKQAQYTD